MNKLDQIKYNLEHGLPIDSEETLNAIMELEQDLDELIAHLKIIQDAHHNYEWSPTGGWDSEAYISDVAIAIKNSPKICIKKINSSAIADHNEKMIDCFKVTVTKFGRKYDAVLVKDILDNVKQLRQQAKEQQ